MYTPHFCVWPTPTCSVFILACPASSSSTKAQPSAWTTVSLPSTPCLCSACAWSALSASRVDYKHHTAMALTPSIISPMLVPPTHLQKTVWMWFLIYELPGQGSVKVWAPRSGSPLTPRVFHTSHWGRRCEAGWKAERRAPFCVGQEKATRFHFSLPIPGSFKTLSERSF